MLLENVAVHHCRLVRFVLAEVLAGLLILQVTLVGLGKTELPEQSLTNLLDYGSFMHSAEALEHDRNPYDYHPDLNPPPGMRHTLNLNPPVALPAFQAMHLIEDHTGRDLVRVATVASHVAMMVLLARRYRFNSGLLVLVAVTVASALAGTMLWGQIYAFLALALTGGWLLLDRGWWVAGVLLLAVVVAIKPQFIVILPLLLLAGYRRESMLLALLTIVFAAIPLVAYGPQVYEQWIEAATASGTRGQWPSNVLSLPSATLALVGDELPGYVLGGGAFLGVAVWTVKRRPEVLAVLTAGIVLAVLASPVSWTGYAAFLIPVIMSRPLNAIGWAGVAMLVLSPGIGVLVLAASLVSQGRLALPMITARRGQLPQPVATP